MILNEIFKSIQGEGLNAGREAIFVRFGNCNLKCTWCDSKYTWKPGESDNVSLELGELFLRITKWPDCKHLVITGGEPMLQQDAIAELKKELPDYYIEVETNGSITPREETLVAVDLFTVSYKTQNSGNATYGLKILAGKCVYKFVICQPEDFDEVERIIKKHNLPPEKIYLMPEGISARQLKEKTPFIQKYCHEKGYKFTTRLHILKWGNERGR